MAGIEVGNDPQELMKAFEELSASGESTETPDNTDNAEAAAAAAKAETDDKAGGKETAPAGEADKGQEAAGLKEDEADGVATRDGKHIIPYSVLQSERARAARAEQLLQEATQRTEQLQAQIDGKNGGQGAKDGEGARTTDGKPGQVDELSAEDMEALKEDFPTVYKALVAQKALVQSLEDKLKPVEERTREQEQNEARTLQETVQSAIDGIPKLAHIQATDRDAWKQAVEFDKVLRNNSAWKDKPIEQRFTQVLKLLEDTNGPIQLPGKKEPDSSKKQPTPEELAQAARKKAAEAAGNGSSVPTSLSEFPAGLPAASDELQSVEQATVHQLAAKFATMNPEEMDSYLSKL